MTACGTCGIALRESAKFCDECGSPIALSHSVAEYKQVTVLFADVVHSMDLAASLGPERLREVMGEVFDRSATVVHRYGGTVDKFTGDGIMALFGAPIALEDHAFRACLAALEIQTQMQDLDVELRIGLNSGEVITGEIGSGTARYTAIGEQVGMAQRMESAAPAGGVMLSESTARLVEHTTVLGAPEMVYIKGAQHPVSARRLLAAATERGPIGRQRSTLVGRTWEMTALSAIMDQSISGHGCVVSVVGPPGIGKSRMVAESVAIANSHGVEVFSTFCESHATDIPFHVVARFLRTVFGVGELDEDAARAGVRTRIPGADPEDLLLLNDLLGIPDPDVALPDIAPDARRRRLASLLNTASLERATPALYVIEDAHWIDEASESMFDEFLAVVPQTHATVLITYRPEYRGALSRTPGAQTIALAPLHHSHTSALTAELLGTDSSVVQLGVRIAERAAGNPFFAEEIVRELAERGVLDGVRGDYTCHADAAEVSVPATLYATIAARIDRLDGNAKRTLTAAAVIGLSFGADLLASLVEDTALAELVEAELIDQVRFTPRSEYAFRHPLIKTVAYESQLKADRAGLHRRLAAEIEDRDPDSVDASAALIAEHLEAAGDLRAAFGWHMRAGTWSTNRDVGAARLSWDRARQVADRLPADDPDSTAMRIAPRTLLCATAWRDGSGADTGFDELRELCEATGDKRSLAIGMGGLVATLTLRNLHREASRMASEYVRLLESIKDPTETVGLLYATAVTKYEAGEVVEALRLTQRVIDVAAGDPTKGNLLVSSPLAAAIAVQGFAKMSLGIDGWREDFDTAIAMSRPFDTTIRVVTVMVKYVLGIVNGAMLSDAIALQDTAEALQIAERSGDDLILAMARLTHGVTLVHQNGPEREAGFELLALTRETALQERSSMTAVPLADIQTAAEKARTGDLDGAIELSRTVIDDMHGTGEMVWHGQAITVLVESLLRRNADGDLQEAQDAINRLAAVPVDPGFVLHELPLLRLRALLERAHGDEATYREFAGRYRRMATELEFEGHTALAEVMT